MSVGLRNPAIDLLRGISIVLVLLHHFNIAYRLQDTALSRVLGWNTVHAIVRNGNYAVTIFFVVSGFLITSNAERRWGQLASIGASTFYRFRAARIMPCILLLLVIVNILATSRITIFQNQPEFGGPVPLWVVDLASLTFWMNVLMSHSGWLNYVLCVQWSLSVEEVFYLSFPILCLLLRRDRLLLLAWSVVIVIGPIWRATHQATEYTELNSYLSCFDGIAFGCCAAVLGRHVRLPARTRTMLQILVAGAMAWFYLSWSIQTTAIYGVTLMALGTAILLILLGGVVSSRRTRPSLLRFCGRLSYELYLFHLVILGSLRTIWPPDDTQGDIRVLLLVAYLLLSIGLATVVGRYYSEPLNRRFRGAFAAA
ncbi:acyltransferase family protein [Lichenicola sp.]|uniref:acyltransferase family protein n=1 Tax=Lichenicola sp. TaxID=2804529 RepID=UPI003B00269A